MRQRGIVAGTGVLLLFAGVGAVAGCSGETAPQPSTSTSGSSSEQPSEDVSARCDGAVKNENSLVSARGKELAMMIVGSAENSTLDWRQAYAYIEYNVEKNGRENRGYTAGIVGFTSKTSDLLDVATRYVDEVPNGALTPYLPALKKVNGTPSYEGLGPAFRAAWKRAAKDPKFREVQFNRATQMYFEPALKAAQEDGVGTLGQFAYVDASIVHGTGRDPSGLESIRDDAKKHAKSPSAGGDEKKYLQAFLDARVATMKTELAHSDVSRIETAQRVWLKQGNTCLALPLRWQVYGDDYEVTEITKSGG